MGRAERVVAVRCLIEVGERRGKVAANQCHEPAVMPGDGVLTFIPGDGEQLLGIGKVRSGTPRKTKGEEDMGPDR